MRESTEGLTPLLMAGNWNRVEVVKYLIKEGADINVRDISGNNLLMRSAKRGHVGMFLQQSIVETKLLVVSIFTLQN